MRIPVFLSAPTSLSPSQSAARAIIVEELDHLMLEPRALGKTDYPSDFPLKEVLVLARHCSGGVILGFEQFKAETGIWKPNTQEKKKLKKPTSFPTAWNNLEAGIMFSLNIPLLVFKDKSISGGIFDNGVSDVFIHPMPVGDISKSERLKLREVILSWQRKVRARYYGD